MKPSSHAGLGKRFAQYRLALSAIIGFFGLVLGFQNCSQNTSEPSSLSASLKQGSDSESGSGSGFDGKLYAHRGGCENPYAVESRIGIDNQSGVASYLIKECKALNQPEVIPAQALNLFERVLIQDRRIFDYELTEKEKASGEVQRITTRFCIHTGTYKKKPFHFVNSLYTFERAQQVLVAEVSDQVVNVVLQMIEQLAPADLLSGYLQQGLEYIVRSIADLFIKILDPQISVTRPVELAEDPMVEVYNYAFSFPNGGNSESFATLVMKIHKLTGLGSMDVSLNFNLLPSSILNWLPLVNATIPEGGITRATVAMDCYTDNLGGSNLGGLPDPSVRPYVDESGKEYFAWRINRSCENVCELAYLHETYPGTNVSVRGECDPEGMSKVSGVNSEAYCAKVLNAMNLGEGQLNAEGPNLAAPGCSLSLSMKRHHALEKVQAAGGDSCSIRTDGFIRLCGCKRKPMQ